MEDVDLNKRIYLSSPHMGGKEQDFVKLAFDTNWIAPLGPNVDGLEEDLVAFTGVAHAAVLSSGTGALHLALKALSVKRGDLVFCSSLTFAATCNPIVYEGATPVLIDSDYESYNMSPSALEKAFLKYPNPKAVIIVNLYGQSADYDKLKAICSKYDVPIIEDAAESLGAEYKGLQTGGFGDIGIFSFNGNKIITTSGGGALVCNDKKIVDKVKFWATQARDKAPHYQHTEIGYNYRMSNILAGIGRGQMLVLKDRVLKKKYIYEYYKKAFEDISEIEFMPICDYGKPNYWLTVITLKRGSKVKPMDIIEKLESENIEARPLWKPMNLQPVYANCDFFSHNGDGEISTSEDLFNRGICLPSDTKITDEELNRVIELIKTII